MEFINLNNENYKLSKIGLGTGLGFYSGGIKQEKKLINALEFAIENKINWIDTAESYFNGYSEKLIGKLLKDINKKIYILSKFSPQNAGKLKLRKAIENSLIRLNRDQIDIYQFHWPNVKIPWHETLETLMELLKEGKIGAIGVSNFSPETTLFDFVMKPDSQFLENAIATMLGTAEYAIAIKSYYYSVGPGSDTKIHITLRKGYRMVTGDGTFYTLFQNTR